MYQKQETIGIIGCIKFLNLVETAELAVSMHMVASLSHIVVQGL